MSTTHIPIGVGANGVGVSVVAINVGWTLSTPGTALDTQLINVNSPCTPQSVNLVMGDNTINATTCPALPQAGGVVLIPPNGNGQLLTLKVVAGDTGLPISAVAPSVYSFSPTPPTSFIINAGGAVTGFQLLWF